MSQQSPLSHTIIQKISEITIQSSLNHTHEKNERLLSVITCWTACSVLNNMEINQNFHQEHLYFFNKYVSAVFL
uniref:Uncharacterized protein n=1 Tax=Anguilla anguilla TaxID=7936 RepID=A0A0E9S288_ANGAN